MRRFTRKEFLRLAASGIAGSVAGGFLSGCTSRVKTGKSVFKPTKIIAFGDMHILDESSTSYPVRVVKAMNKEGGDLVLACGDLGTDGKRSELELAKGVLGDLKLPYYPVLGNHDALYAGEKDEILFREIFSLKQNNYHFMKNGIHFIGIDHGCGNNYKENSVRPNVISWIKSTLSEIPDEEPVILFSHYPFAEKARSRTKNSSEVKALFENKNLLAIISGHFHANTEYHENGILMTTTACCSSTRRNHNRTKAKGFRIFYVDDDMNVTTEFKEVV